MRDRVLLGRRPQSERPAAGRLGGRFEDGVVAEAAGAARRGGDPAAARPAREPERQAPVRTAPGAGLRGRIGRRQGQGEDADVAGPASIRRQVAEGREQQRVVLGVGGVLPGIPARAYARAAVEGIDLQPGVVGEGRL